MDNVIRADTWWQSVLGTKVRVEAPCKDRVYYKENGVGERLWMSYSRFRLAFPTKLKERTMEINKKYERHEDMSPDGMLAVMKQEDGDLILEIRKIDPVTRKFQWVEVEFCAIGSGGGKSSHTRKALVALALAIEKDNEERPIPVERITDESS
jgi:hypothetical protein